MTLFVLPAIIPSRTWRSYHQVVAIAFLHAEIQRSETGETYVLKELRSGGEADFTEAQLLEGFSNISNGSSLGS